MTEEEVKILNNLPEQISRKLFSVARIPEFTKGGVPVKVAASVFGKSETWVRGNIENGLLPIGIITKESDTRTNVYISPKLLWELTGYEYRE